MAPVVSIIVPVFNVERYLGRCMETLLGQTMENIEIILIDDGAPDHCPAICDRYDQQDERIRVIHKKNQGLGLARNSGLDIARGEYIAFVDSDDYVDRDMCAKLYEVAKRYDADLVYGGNYYQEGDVVRASRSISKETVWRGQEEIRGLLLDLIATEPGKTRDTMMEVSVWKAIFRRTILEEYHIRFVSERQFISEDVIFDIDYLPKCQCVVAIPSPVYYYCNHSGSLSKILRLDRFQKDRQLYDEVKRRLGALFERDVYQERCDRFLIARARIDVRTIALRNNPLTGEERHRAIVLICEDEELRKILLRYPIEKLPVKHFLAALLMKHRKYQLLKWLFAFS